MSLLSRLHLFFKKQQSPAVKNAYDFLKKLASKDDTEIKELTRDGNWVFCTFNSDGYRVQCTASTTGNELSLTLLNIAIADYTPENLELVRIACNRFTIIKPFSSVTYNANMGKRKICIDTHVGIIEPTEESFMTYMAYMMITADEVRDCIAFQLPDTDNELKQTPKKQYLL